MSFALSFNSLTQICGPLRQRTRLRLLGGWLLFAILGWALLRLWVESRRPPNITGTVIGSTVCEQVEENITSKETWMDPPLADASTCLSETDYIVMAQCLLGRLEQNQLRPPFLFVSMGNAAFVPFIQNWLCNTAGMHGVHDRTLFLFPDSSGPELLRNSEFNPFSASVATSDGTGDLDYDTYGYWKATQHRLHVVCRLVENDIPILLFEPDALWVRNPLLDPCLWSGADLIAFDDNSGVPGFGWLRIWPTKQVKALFRDLKQAFDKELDGYRGSAMNRSVHLAGEQDLLYRLLQLRHWAQKPYAGIEVQLLKSTKYVSGRWYDGGRGGDGTDFRRRCKQEGAPYVVNNNWIVGNAPKIARARRWGHWFVQDEASGSCNDRGRLEAAMALMLSTMDSLAPVHGPPPREECPLC